MLTYAGGNSQLRAPRKGGTCSALRIAFGSTTTDLGELATGESGGIVLRITPVVVRLGCTVVEGDVQEWRVHGEQGLATATEQEEARKALAAVART